MRVVRRNDETHRAAACSDLVITEWQLQWLIRPDAALLTRFEFYQEFGALGKRNFNGRGHAYHENRRQCAALLLGLALRQRGRQCGFRRAIEPKRTQYVAVGLWFGDVRLPEDVPELLLNSAPLRGSADHIV